MYLDHVHNTLVNGTNSFKDSVADRYAMTSENGGKIFIDPNAQLADTIKKTYTPITVPSLLGRGAGIFFNCNQDSLKCNLTLGDQTTMKDNRVKDMTAGSFVDEEKDRAIYFTGDTPPNEPTDTHQKGH